MCDRRLPLRAELGSFAPHTAQSRALNVFHKSALALALGAFVLTSGAFAQQRFFDATSKSAFLEQVPERERGYVVDVGSRYVYPQPGERVPFTNGRAEVYLQFHDPITSAERGELTRAGVRFFQALSATTYLARLSPQALQELQKLPNLRGIEPVQSVDKVEEAIYTGRVRVNVPNVDGTWNVYVRFYPDVKLEHALSLLDSVRAFVHVRDRYELNERIAVASTQARLLELAKNPFVREISQIPAKAIPFNVNSAALINVNDITIPPYNLNGGGAVIGEWDEGPVRDDHPDLTGRVFIIEDNGGGDGDHSTHVCGTMIGNGSGNASALGMAPFGAVMSSDFNGNPADEHDTLAAAVASFGFAMQITNNSWGAVLGWDQGADTGNEDRFGAYDGEAADFDTVARARNLIICKAAGNDANDCNPGNSNDCDGQQGSDGLFYLNQPTWSVSKNVVTVGATNDDGTYASFSSAGPALDGRIKPDVCANGVNLFSTWALGNTLPGLCDGADYCSISGTSMASPSVAGACALLVQRYNQVIGLDPAAEIIKAVLVNTAVDQGRPGPDYLFGHGLVDALAAAQTIDVAPVRILTNAVDQNQLDEFLLAVPGGTPVLNATLAWLDPEGAADSNDPDIVNNLDLTLVSPSNQTFFPFSGPGNNFTNNATATGPNALDTVEHVRILNPQQGFWRVRVRGTNVPSGPQNYALVADRSFSLPDQPNITVNAALDFDEICDGEFQDKVVSIFNTGGAPLAVHQVELFPFSGGTFTLHPDPLQPFLVQPGAHVDVTVHFDPDGPGLHSAGLVILSNDPDQPTYSVIATGTGCPPPDIAVSGSLDFGTVCAGTLAEKTIQVCNIGVDDLIVTSLDFFQCSDFKVVNNIFPATVLGGHCLPVTIRYTPTGAGDHACFLAILSNDPDEPLVTLLATGSTPTNSLDVPLPACFPPTVIQSVSASCKSEQPYSITNTGACPVLIKSVTITPPGPHASDFTIVGLPSLPVTLQPGAVLGGGVLKLVFKPTNVERYVTGTLNVTYQSDSPTLGSLTTISQPLAGEGVKTGARLLVNHLGAFVPLLDRVTLYKVNSMTPLDLQFVDQQNNVPVKFDPGTGNCLGFLFHREWGGVTNPIKLEPGDYLIEIGVHINAVPYLLKQDFTVGVCDFIPDLVIDF